MAMTIRSLAVERRRRSKSSAGEHAARRRRAPHGPYLGAGVWLKSCSSVTQVKFAAMLVLPLPLYFATLGKRQSGRVIWTAGGVSLTNLVATIVSGATPVSTQLTSGVSASNVFGPGPPEQWYNPGTAGHSFGSAAAPDCRPW